MLKANTRLSDKADVVKQLVRGLLGILMILSSTISLGAQTAEEWFEKGIEAFRWRKIGEASAFFIKAAETDPASPDYPFYVGLCYQQSGRYTDAEAAYEKSLSLGGNPDTVLLQRGNLRWTEGDVQGALDDYTRVVEGGGESVSAALLNRANLELNNGMYEQVLQDYAAYLAMEPKAPDRENIEKIIALVNAEIEAARLAEVQRLADEARRAEEEARRQALMAKVRESLDDSGDNAKSISAGSESIREEFEESDLED